MPFSIHGSCLVATSLVGALAWSGCLGPSAEVGLARECENGAVAPIAEPMAVLLDHTQSAQAAAAEFEQIAAAFARAGACGNSAHVLVGVVEGGEAPLANLDWEIDRNLASFPSAGGNDNIRERRALEFYLDQIEPQLGTLLDGEGGGPSRLLEALETAARTDAKIIALVSDGFVVEPETGVVIGDPALDIQRASREFADRLGGRLEGKTVAVVGVGRSTGAPAVVIRQAERALEQLIESAGATAVIRRDLTQPIDLG